MTSDNRRTAVVTGGGGDLARAVRAELEAIGWRVLAPDRRELDVGDGAAIRQWFAAAGRVDYLVNNAGIRRDRAMSSLAEADWDAVVGVCLRGAFLCAQAAARQMIGQGGGAIVNIGSHSARGAAGQAAYAAAKAGLEGLTRSLAVEWGPHNIRVNCVLPGWLETKFTTGLPPKVVEAARARHTLGRFASVRGAAAFLARLPDMRDMSGKSIALDSRILPG